MKKLSLIVLLLLLVAGAGAGAGYWFLGLEADEDELGQENRAPQAVIATDPTDGQVKVNETVKFQGHQSSDPDHDPLTYYWDFGDDNSSWGLTVSHAYGAEGTYTVRLTVTDTAGLSDFAEKVITVTEPQVDTTDENGTVSCDISPLSDDCDTNEVNFTVREAASKVRLEWILEEGDARNAGVAITIYNAAGDAVFNETQGEGEDSEEFSGADLESLGDWVWEIKAEQGSMNWDVIIRVEY